MSGKAATDPAHEAWVLYARACVKPGLDYFECQLASLIGSKRSVEVFKGCRLFSPQKVHIIQPNTSTIDNNLSTIPFLNSRSELDGLKSAYLARATDTDQNFDVLEWWRRNAPAKKNISSTAVIRCIREGVFSTEKFIWRSAR